MDIQPEEMVVKTLQQNGIDASVSLNYDKSNEYVIVVRNGMNPTPADWGQGMLIKTYDIMLAIYAPSKFEAAVLADKIFDIMYEIELDYPNLSSGAVGSTSSISDFNKKSAYALNLILAFEHQPQNPNNIGE